MNKIESIDNRGLVNPINFAVIIAGRRENGSLDDESRKPSIVMQIRNLSAGFSVEPVIDEVDLDIVGSRITALIGPSGCGKTTLIRCLNRMHEEGQSAWVKGSIELGGQDIYGEGVDPVMIRRLVGMVFQKPNPFPFLTVANNVIAGSILRSEKVPNREEVIERSLRAVALWDEVKDKLNASGLSLSGGQQQRLCIARAIAAEPKVLLLDEPCASLDPPNTFKIEELILELKKRYTIVIVTHNMQQAGRLSNYAAMLYREPDQDEKHLSTGKIVEYGPSSEFFLNPKSKITEDYLTGRF